MPKRQDKKRRGDTLPRGVEKSGSWKENERSQQECMWLYGLPESPSQGILHSTVRPETIRSLELAKKLAEENLSMLARPGLPISLEPARQVLAEVRADSRLVTAQSLSHGGN